MPLPVVFFSKGAKSWFAHAAACRSRKAALALRKLTKGFRASRHNLYRQSLVTLIRGRVYAFRDRRVRKRMFRRLWIIRINAACRSRGTRYSQLMHGLQKAAVELNRQSLSEIAIHDATTFDKIVELAKKNL